MEDIVGVIRGFGRFRQQCLREPSALDKQECLNLAQPLEAAA